MVDLLDADINPYVAARRSRQEKYGQIYIAEAFGLRRVKIGFSINAMKRLQTIAIVCPVPLRLLVLLDGPPSLERELHERFRKGSSHGEWFDLDRCSKLIAFIRKNLLDDPQFITCSKCAEPLEAAHQASPF